MGENFQYPQIYDGDNVNKMDFICGYRAENCHET